MKCPKCNKEVSELEEKCAFCGLDFEEYENQQKTEENENSEYGSKTIILKFLTTIQLIGCLICAIILWSNEEIGLGFIALIGGIIASAFIKGFTDIIDLLDEINNKLNQYKHIN